MTNRYIFKPKEKKTFTLVYTLKSATFQKTTTTQIIKGCALHKRGRGSKDERTHRAMGTQN